MKRIHLVIFVALGLSYSSQAQQQVNNGGFESWDALGSSNEEPTNWSGMMTGNLCGFCGLGASQRVWRDGSVVHGGSYSARIQSTSYLGNIVNGAITTGQVNAPSTTPSEGYNKTVQSNAAFNHPFTSYPDSIVFWAKYNITTSADSARVSFTIHSAYDVRDPSDAGSAPYVVARAVKNFQTNGTGAWKRISVPFNYASYPATTAAYFLASVTSSKTAGAGSSSAILWIDDMTMIYNPPVTAFTASNLTVCAGQSVSFTNSTTSNSAVSYAWNFGDGGTSTSTNPTYTYNTPGTYTVQLSATNAGGTDIETVSITVNAAPSVSITGPTSVCLGSSITLTANGASTYLWGGGLGSGASKTVSPTSQTTYTVTGTQGGCTGNASVIVNVDVQDDPGTPIGLSACVALTSLDLFGGLTGEDPGGTWSDDNSTGALSGNIFNPSMVSAGSYNFTYTHPATGACAAATATVTVVVTSSVSAGSPSGNNTACASDNAYDLFNALTGYTSGGDWNDDSATGALSGNLFDATAVTPGTYSFTYSFAPGSCGTDTETISIVVATPPVITASNDDEICIGESTTITASGGVLYDWDNGLGLGNSQTVSPTTTTTYTVIGANASGCTNTDQVTITVHALPNVSAGADFSVCEGSQATLYGSGAFTYTWNNGVSNGISFTPPSGTTNYTVTGTNQYGCENTDDVNVTVLPLPTVTIDNFTVSSLCTYDAPVALPSGTPAGGYYSGAGVSGNNFDPSLVLPAVHSVSYVYTDGNGCTNYASTDIEVSLCLGIAENGEATFLMMPNPASNSFTIETGSAHGTLIVTDASGRKVLEIAQINESIQVDCSSWQNGTYFVEWLSENGSQQSIQKLQILH